MANNEIEATVTYSFLCGIRGFHVYKEVWKPILGERLNLSHERKNLYHRYAIAAYKRLPGRFADSIIGHLPREIPRRTLFFLLRGGLAVAEVIRDCAIIIWRGGVSKISKVGLKIKLHPP